jgi:hypothetical protein
MGICCYLPDPQANSRLDRGGGSEQNSSEGDDPEAPLSLIFSRRGGRANGLRDQRRWFEPRFVEEAQCLSDIPRGKVLSNGLFRVNRIWE